VRVDLVEEVRAREILSRDRLSASYISRRRRPAGRTRLSASSHAFLSSVRFALFTLTSSCSAGSALAGAGAAAVVVFDMSADFVVGGVVVCTRAACARGRKGEASGGGGREEGARALLNVEHAVTEK
jgi:hypothetical protein